MATSDVPGVNGDGPLSKDCWAESSNNDGSYIKVESVENGRVIYSMFDTRNPMGPQWFHDAMSQSAFERQFSWRQKDPKSVHWVWHDKHADDFPWDVIIKAGLPPGASDAMAANTIRRAAAITDTLRNRVTGDDATVETDAMRVARDLGLAAQEIPPDSPGLNRAAREIALGFQRAIRALRQ